LHPLRHSCGSRNPLVKRTFQGIAGLTRNDGVFFNLGNLENLVEILVQDKIKELFKKGQFLFFWGLARHTETSSV